MAHDPDPDPVIEVEVIEIDGKVPPPPNLNARPATSLRRGAEDEDASSSGHPWTNWQRWPGQARNLNPLWWPVLIVGGGILLVVFLTVGLALGVLFVIYRIVRTVLGALFG